MTFKNKLILSIVSVQLGVLVLFSFIGLHFVDRVVTDALQTKANDISKFLQPVGIVGIQKNDMLWFQRTAKLVLLSEDIDAVRLVDTGGKVLVDEKISKGNIADDFIFRKNLTKGSKVFGQLTIHISRGVEASALESVTQTAIYIALGFAVFLGLLGFYIGNILLKKNELDFIIAAENPDNFAGEVVVREKFSVKEPRHKKHQIQATPVEAESDPLVELKIIEESPQFDVVEESPGLALVDIALETTIDGAVEFPEIVNKSYDAIILTDLKGSIIEYNLAAEKLFGFNRAEMMGKNVNEKLLAGPSIERYSKFLAAIGEQDNQKTDDLFESKYCDTEGRSIDLSIHLSTITSAGHKQVVLYSRDISEHKATANRLNYLAFNDELTDLPNVSLLSDHIRKATFEASANDRQIVVLKIGLDRFKHINESLGHRFGDYLIRNIASRLKIKIRRGDMVSRINGDQFVIALVDVSNDSNLDVLVQKYLDSFIEPFQVETQNIHVNISIGVTVYPGDEKTVDGLLRNAESAMFHAKEKGGNNYQFFSQEMREISQERLFMENELRKALELDQFVLHYQPQVNLKTGKIIGVEALIRWQHPELGMVPPLNFIPLAEEIGLIIPIGEWVLRTACKHNIELIEERGEPLILAVNLSARQFKEYDLVNGIAAILNETAYPPELLELEITESLLMENMDDVAATLNVLSDQGIRISMDDFGTGYSSLSYLKSFPINTLKVDRSFVQDLENDENNACIVTATIQMAHSLNIDIVAEGVETEGQLKILAEKQCDKIQGYYFSRPLESKALRELLDENRKIELKEGSMRLISGFQ